MDSPLEPPGGNQPRQHLHLGRLASRTVRDRFLLLEATEIVVICYSSPRKLIQPSTPTVWKSISLATSPLGMLTVQHSGGSWGLVSASLWAAVVEHPEEDWGSLEGLPWPGSLSGGLSSACPVTALRAGQPGGSQWAPQN